MITGSEEDSEMSDTPTETLSPAHTGIATLTYIGVWMNWVPLTKQTGSGIWVVHTYIIYIFGT